MLSGPMGPNGMAGLPGAMGPPGRPGLQGALLLLKSQLLLQSSYKLAAAAGKGSCYMQHSSCSGSSNTDHTMAYLLTQGADSCFMHASDVHTCADLLSLMCIAQ